MNKYSRGKLLEMKPVEVYKLVLSKEINEFPKDYFELDGKLNIYTIRAVTKYMIEDILKFSHINVCRNLSKKHFQKYRLYKMLKKQFDENIIDLIMKVYPNEYRIGEFKGYQSYLEYMSPVEIYKLLLSNDIKVFPNNFFTLDGKINVFTVRSVTKYMIENILCIPPDDIPTKLSRKDFQDNKLDAMLNSMFNRNINKLLEVVYPGKYKNCKLKNYCEDMSPIEVYKLILSGKRKAFPNNYFKKGNGINEYRVQVITKYMIEQVLHFTEEDIEQELSIEHFIDNGLSGIICSLYNSSINDLLEVVYPGKYNLIEARRYWNVKRIKREVKLLIEEKLNWSHEDVCNYLCEKTFKEAGLAGMIKRFNGSTYKVLNIVYPNQYKPWELKSIPKGYWTIETAIDAIKWLIEEKLNWSHEDVKNKLTKEIFKKYKLYSMLNSIFDGSIYMVLNATYPDEYKRWEIKPIPKSYWTRETEIEAIKWLIEEKLNWSHEDVRKQLSTETFKQYGLYSMLYNMFNGSIYMALNLAYPNEYKPWELKVTPRGYWTRETAIEAIKWLIEEKLNWTDEEVCNRFSHNILVEYGLDGMVCSIFKNKTYDALNAAYPNKYKPSELRKINPKQI